MPIARELRPLYRTPEYQQARLKAKARAQNRCLWCHKPNGAKIRTRSGGGRMIWRPRGHDITWRSETGWPVGFDQLNELLERVGAIRDITVVCTAAHLDHDPRNNSDENVAWLCQWHHLMHDRGKHKLTRSIHKDEKRPLLHWEQSA